MNRIIIFLLAGLTAACSAGAIKKQRVTAEQRTIIKTNIDGKGPEISLELFKGESFYYPLMAAWIEDESGKYIQTLYVPVTVATGVFKYGKQEKNRWISSPKRAPQTLPYWSHKRGVIASDGLYIPEPGNPVPDAYSGATPTQSFVLNAKADKELPEVFRVLFEINQNWDWNEYWTNDKFPDDENYKMSCQPALVYETVIDTRKQEQDYSMKPIGHSHYSGKTGELFSDLNTLTTALHIADSIIVRVKIN
jgi:hypothetical protein